MTHKEFEEQLDKLKERYNAKVYSMVVILAMWDEFEWVPVKDFEFVVNKFLTESRFAPLLPEFRMEFARQRERKNENEKEQRKKIYGIKASEVAKHIGQILKEVNL